MRAVFSLYANKYDEALACINLVLEQCRTTDALYVKSRCLAKLGHYSAADEVNVDICEDFDMKNPNKKVLYMIAMLNELHIGDPGIQYMSMLVDAMPQYNGAILALRVLMKHRACLLDLVADDEERSSLVELFNSDISNEEFEEMLATGRVKNKNAVKYLLTQIGKLKTASI